MTRVITIKSINKIILSVGAPLSAHCIANILASHCAPKGAPTDHGPQHLTGQSLKNY